MASLRAFLVLSLVALMGLSSAQEEGGRIPQLCEFLVQKAKQEAAVSATAAQELIESLKAQLAAPDQSGELAALKATVADLQAQNEALRSEVAQASAGRDQAIEQGRAAATEAANALARARSECSEKTEVASQICASAKGDLEAKLSNCKALASTAEQRATMYYEAQLLAERKAVELGQVVPALEAQLEALKSAATCELKDVIPVLTKSASKSFATVAAEVKVLAADLQQGNTTRLSLRANEALAAVLAAHATLHASVMSLLDQHLPQVKEVLSKGLETAGGLYEKHIAEAAWVQEISRVLNTANSELKAMLTKQILAHKALAPLNDPVYIQLIAYAIIGAPVMLLFLPVLLWLLSLLAPASKASAPAAKSQGKGKAASKKKSK